MNIHTSAKPPCPLSEKQLEAIKWLSFGKTSVEVCEIMGLKHRMTLDRVLSPAFVKTETYTRHGLVAVALRRGWIQ